MSIHRGLVKTMTLHMPSLDVLLIIIGMSYVWGLIFFAPYMTKGIGGDDSDSD